jgi:hypothetical protein
MWEPQHLTTPWAFKACYRDSFTLPDGHARFEVLMVLTLKITVLWDGIPCSLMECYQHFGETCCLRVEEYPYTLKMEDI